MKNCRGSYLCERNTKHNCRRIKNFVMVNVILCCLFRQIFLSVIFCFRESYNLAYQPPTGDGHESYRVKL